MIITVPQFSQAAQKLKAHKEGLGIATDLVFVQEIFDRFGYGNQDVVVKNANPYVQKQSGYHQNNLLTKLRYKPSEHWDIQYGFHYSKTGNRFNRRKIKEDNYFYAIILNL